MSQDETFLILSTYLIICSNLNKININALSFSLITLNKVVVIMKILISINNLIETLLWYEEAISSGI